MPTARELIIVGIWSFGVFRLVSENAMEMKQNRLKVDVFQRVAGGLMSFG